MWYKYRVLAPMDYARKPGDTDALREMAKTTVYSLSDLLALKKNCNLTDYGVKTILEICSPLAISPYSIIDLVIKSK